MTELRPRPCALPPPVVRFMRDSFDTLFAVEVVHLERWDDRLRVPPSVEVADVRIAFLEHGELPRLLPPWLGICAAPPPPTDEPWLVALAERLWLRSPSHRLPGAPPQEYLRAAFQALCPPHPPCDAGPRARETVVAYAAGRAAPIGRLAEVGRDGFDRWLQVGWPTPEALAEDVLVERMRDAGLDRAVEAIRRLARAEVEPASEFDALARERQALLVRLAPLQCFADRTDFDTAVREAEVWWDRYASAYAAHCRRLAAMAHVLPSELLAAITVADLLRSLNGNPRRGSPVGDAALARLEAAVETIRAIPTEPHEVPAPGIVLGRVPPAFAEARLAAAAVLAAVDVHKRRGMF